MKFQYPTKPFVTGQGFGQNFIPSGPNNPYNSYKAHSGLDIGASYGQEIYAVADGECYSVLNKGNPDPMKYKSVYQLVQDETGKWFEIIYGHCSEILVSKGDKLKAGQVIAKAGNSGPVFSGGVEVSREDKEKGSTAGTHLHFNLRPLVKDSKAPEKHYRLYDGEGWVIRDGERLAYELPYEEYAASIDPMPYFAQRYIFNRDLQLGDKNEDVRQLQLALNKLGYFNFELTGYFGLITREALYKFQLKYVSLSWYEKYILTGKKFGAKSRTALNSLNY